MIRSASLKPERDLVPKVAARALQLLSRAGEVRPLPSNHTDYGSDCVMEFQREGQAYFVAFQVKSEAQPRQAAQFLQWLRQHELKQAGRKVYFVLAAPFLSERVRALCEEEGVGYLDLSGNAHLELGPVFIETSGPYDTNIYKETRRIKSLFGQKATRILRALLAEPERVWKGKELAEAVDVSPGTVSWIKFKLVEEGLITEARDHIELLHPGELLDLWVKNDNGERGAIHKFYTMDSPPQAEDRIAASGARLGRYAFTTYSAADKLAPYTNYLKIHLYFDGDPADLAHAWKWKPVDTGANVYVIRPDDEGVFYSTIEKDGRRLVHPVQNYLDLMREGGRAQDQAEELRRVVLKY